MYAKTLISELINIIIILRSWLIFQVVYIRLFLEFLSVFATSLPYTHTHKHIQMNVYKEGFIPEILENEVFQEHRQ